LAEADCRVNMACATVSGVTDVYCFMGHCSNFEFDTTVNRQISPNVH